MPGGDCPAGLAQSRAATWLVHRLLSRGRDRRCCEHQHHLGDLVGFHQFRPELAIDREALEDESVLGRKRNQAHAPRQETALVPFRGFQQGDIGVTIVARDAGKGFRDSETVAFKKIWANLSRSKISMPVMPLTLFCRSTKCGWSATPAAGPGRGWSIG